MKKSKDITPEELEDIIRDYLENQGFGVAYVEGYIDAQKKAGWLRPNCPAWMRNSVAVHYLLPHACGGLADDRK